MEYETSANNSTCPLSRFRALANGRDTSFVMKPMVRAIGEEQTAVNR